MASMSSREISAGPQNPRKVRVPLIAEVRIAAPCEASWEEMAGDERVRFCDQCQKHVFNLSAMARDEAEQLIADVEGDMCARVYQRADGMVLTSDCPEGVRLRRRKRLAVGVAAIGLTAAGAAALVTHKRPLGEVMTQSVVVEAPEAVSAPEPAPAAATAHADEPEAAKEIVEPSARPATEPHPAVGPKVRPRGNGEFRPRGGLIAPLRD